jgi:hypothetical protein
MEPVSVSPGGLQVHPRLRSIELRRALLVGVSGLIVAGGLVVFALWRTWSAVDAEMRYRSGVRATHAQVVTWSSEREVVARVKATVAYADARGAEHVHELSVLRLLVTPEPNDAIEVRYAASEPARAVTSWERASVPHELAIALVIALLVAVLVRGGWREVRVSRDRLALAEELARSGELAVVELLERKRDDQGFRVMFRYRFRTPAGTVLEGGIASSEGGAYRWHESERQSVALLSRDGRRGLLLARSGYPLLNVSEHLPAP